MVRFGGCKKDYCWAKAKVPVRRKSEEARNSRINKTTNDGGTWTKVKTPGRRTPAKNGFVEKRTWNTNKKCLKRKIN